MNLRHHDEAKERLKVHHHDAQRQSAQQRKGIWKHANLILLRIALDSGHKAFSWLTGRSSEY